MQDTAGAWLMTVSTFFEGENFQSVFDCHIRLSIGKIIMREHQILTVDKTELISKVQAIVKRFTQIP